MAQSIHVLGGSTSWASHALAAACQDRGIDIHFFDISSIAVIIHQSVSNLSPYLIIRQMPNYSFEQSFFAMNILHHWHMMGIRIVNQPRACEIAIDKYFSAVLFQQANLPIPRTVVAFNAAQLMQLVQADDYPVVVKPIFGSEGRGQLFIEHSDMLYRVATQLRRLGSVLYVQKYIHSTHDYRLLMLNQNVLVCYRRIRGQHWRTNSHYQPAVAACEAPAGLVELARKATATIGVEFAGVDVLEDQDGQYYVLEVNAIPGWRVAQQFCSSNISQLFLDYVLSR